MSQTIILYNFKEYLDFTSKDYLDALEEQKKHQQDIEAIKKVDQEIINHKAYITKIKNTILSKGFCHGFSVCHAAMDAIDKLNWWEAVLFELADWDGKRKSLDNIISLPNAIQPETLSSLFERALNYIFYHQVSYDEFSLKNTLQNRLLQPANTDKSPAYFELLSPAGKILCSKNRAIASGHFTKEELLSLLDEKQIQENLCILSNNEHAIRVGYKGESWIVYDPNYSHRKHWSNQILFDAWKSPTIPKKTIFKKCTKNEAVDEILKILGHAIAIQMASLKSDTLLTFPSYQSSVKTKPLELIDQSGLRIIAKYNPKVLLELCHLADGKKNKPLLEKITAILSENSEKSENDPWADLHSIVFFASEAMLKLCKIAHRDKNLLTTITQALPKKNSDNWTVLHTTARYAPEAMLELCQLAAYDKNLLETIAQFLIKKQEDDWTVLHLTARYAPKAMLPLCQLALQSEHLLEAISQTLLEKNKDGITGLRMVATFTPKAINELCNLAKINKIMAHTLRQGVNSLRCPECIETIQTALSERASWLLNHQRFFKDSNAHQNTDIHELKIIPALISS
ncbi:MAG: hypothetical protein SFW66_05740 [Gammaproteobacteria bacterium]|nr:hypothetical protein [Gammaproteobacteria bacterium]